MRFNNSRFMPPMPGQINFLFLIFSAIFMASNNKHTRTHTHTHTGGGEILGARHAYLLPFFMGPRLTPPSKKERKKKQKYTTTNGGAPAQNWENGVDR